MLGVVLGGMIICSPLIVAGIVFLALWLTRKKKSGKSHKGFLATWISCFAVSVFLIALAMFGSTSSVQFPNTMKAGSMSIDYPDGWSKTTLGTDYFGDYQYQSCAEVKDNEGNFVARIYVMMPGVPYSDFTEFITMPESTVKETEIDGVTVFQSSYEQGGYASAAYVSKQGGDADTLMTINVRQEAMENNTDYYKQLASTISVELNGSKATGDELFQ